MRGVVAGIGLWMGTALIGGASVEAQIVIGGSADERCECVDRDGNRIENCVCVRSGESPLRSFSLARVGRRAQIGVYLDMQQSDAEVGGVAITRVMSDSPAEEGALREGDVVLSVAGVSVRERLDDAAEAELDGEKGSLFAQRFVAIVRDLEPGQEVDVVVLRDGDRRTLRITPRGASAVLGLSGALEEGFDIRLDEEVVEDALRRAQEALEGREFELREFQEEDMQRVQEELERAEEKLRGLSFRFESEFEDDARDRLQRERLRFFDRSDARGFPGEGIVMFGDDPCVRLRSGSGSGPAVTILGGGSCVDGVELARMNEGLSVYFGTDEGVLVTEVAEGSALGLEPGDVVLRIGEREVSDVDDVRRILDSYELDETVAFRVRRENREINVSGTRRAP